METGIFKNIDIVNFVILSPCYMIIFITEMQSNNSNILAKTKTLYIFLYITRILNISNRIKHAIIIGNVRIRILKITRDYHVAAFSCPIIYRVRISFSVTFKSNVLSNICSFQLIWYREHGWNCNIEIIFITNYLYFPVAGNHGTQ